MKKEKIYSIIIIETKTKKKGGGKQSFPTIAMNLENMIREMLAKGATPEEVANEVSVLLNAIKEEEVAEKQEFLDSLDYDDPVDYATFVICDRHKDWELETCQEFRTLIENQIKVCEKLAPTAKKIKNEKDVFKVMDEFFKVF